MLFSQFSGSHGRSWLEVIFFLIFLHVAHIHDLRSIQVFSRSCVPSRWLGCTLLFFKVAITLFLNMVWAVGCSLCSLGLIVIWAHLESWIVLSFWVMVLWIVRRLAALLVLVCLSFLIVLGYSVNSGRILHMTSSGACFAIHNKVLKKKWKIQNKTKTKEELLLQARCSFLPFPMTRTSISSGIWTISTILRSSSK